MQIITRKIPEKEYKINILMELKALKKTCNHVYLNYVYTTWNYDLFQ